MRVKTGDDLLSHGLSPHYHRRGRVSLPSSERDRVVPRRYDHQIMTLFYWCPSDWTPAWKAKAGDDCDGCVESSVGF